MTAPSEGRGGRLDEFAAWVVANGGEVVDRTDATVRYRSVAGDGSLTLGGREPSFTGDARVAWSCCRIGTTLSPFGLYEPVPVITPAATPFRPARHRATVISDASLCQETGAAGWAAWMIADGMPSTTRGAPIDIRCANSTEAELFAIAEAMRAAIHDGYAPDGAEVLIQSDSTGALALVRKAVPDAIDRRHATHGAAVVVTHKAPHSAIVERTSNAIGRLVRRHRLTIHVRHVPGHTAGDGRQWVNRQCDAEAKRHMRAARAALATPPRRDPDPGRVP